MKSGNRILTVVLLVFVLLFTGCHSKTSDDTSAVYYDDYEVYEYGAGSSNSYAAFAAEEFAAGDYAAEEEAPMDSSDGSAAAGATQQRMIQKSASINIQVSDPQQVADTIAAMAEEMGGFVISSAITQEYYSGSIYLPRADLSIRVPAERLMEMLTFIEGQTSDTGKYVSNKRIYGYDITSQYVDTTSRLTSLERTRDKLLEILDTAEDASDALEIYTSIADVEEDIEVLKGQIKYMEESVALSSIDIRVSSIKPAPTTTASRWSLGDVFSDAFETLLGAGQGLIELLVYVLVVVLPILIFLAIPVVIIILLIRRGKKSKKNNKGESSSKENNEDVLSEVNGK